MCETLNPGKVTLTVDIVKNAAPSWPVVEFGDSFYIIVSGENLEEAIKDAV